MSVFISFKLEFIMLKETSSNFIDFKTFISAIIRVFIAESITFSWLTFIIALAFLLTQSNENSVIRPGST